MTSSTILRASESEISERTIGERLPRPPRCWCLRSAGGIGLYSHRAKPLIGERDAILVTDFVNTTADPVFDGH